jgi:hypothetical protein
MPKQIPEQEVEALLAIIRQSDAGVAVEDIEAKLEQKFPRRTLQHLIVCVRPSSWRGGRAGADA